MVSNFLIVLYAYSKDILPVLCIGFLLSGVIHEFIPENLIEKYLGKRNIKGILYSTVIGAIVPVCCFGSLPIAVSFHKKGASIGAIMAMLIATPATSITAFLVTIKFFGVWFALFLFFAVIIMAAAVGITANKLNLKIAQDIEKSASSTESCPACEQKKNSFLIRLMSILKYAFIDMPKTLGMSLITGLLLAAFIRSLTPLDYILTNYVNDIIGYLFSIFFGLSTYICATMSVPLVHALIVKGLGIGPGLVLLLIGPITSYSTILVLKRQFGLKVLTFYLISIVFISVIFANIYALVSN